MENEVNITEIIGTLKEHAEKMCLRRQELQEDEGMLKGVIERLNLHTCSVNYDGNAGWTEKEKIMNAYQKAREDRDEYKFRLHLCENKIKELKEELNAVRLNQTQCHNISIADLSLVNERKSSAYPSKLDAGEELNTTTLVPEETCKRELNYLHKTNQRFLEKIRKLESERLSQEALLEKLNTYEGEITKLRKIIEEKQTKMMEMQIEFDEKFRNSKRDFTFQISALNSKILELEVVRDAQKIDLEAAREEIRLLKLSIKKPVEEAAEHNNSIKLPKKAVTNSEQTQKETSHGKEEPLKGITRREKRGQLQSIENLIEHEHSTLTSLLEHSLTGDQQVEVTDLGGAKRGTKRNQRGGKGPKKVPAASKKEEAKKMKSSEEKIANTLHNIKNESLDASSSNTRKGTRARALVNTKRKATDSSKDAAVTNNKQNQKMTPTLETDENVEPCPLDYSSSSFNGTLGKMKLTEDTSTPVRKQLKKVQDGNNKRTYHRRNN